MMLEHTSFRQRDAVELAHALCAFIAEENGLRAVSIKGFTLEYYALRAPRTSADADVWVDPKDQPQLIDALIRRGWRERFLKEVPTVMPIHAVTLFHPEWPCDIDLHSYFPGLFAPRHDLFELLWQNTVTATAANVNVRIPTLPASLSIGLVHALRLPESPRHVNELDTLASRFLQLRDSDKDAVATFLTETRALGALSDDIRSTILGPRIARTKEEDRERDAWLLYLDSLKHGTTLAWIHGIKRASVHRKPILLWRALYPTHYELEQKCGSRLTKRAAWRQRAKRLAGAIRSIPFAVKALANHARRSDMS